MSGAVQVFAPAKINLTLHVTGRRADGYHLLDSLVMFADIGDRITLRPDVGLDLTVGGPKAAGVPTGPENLILRAAALCGFAGQIHLDKHLPMAAGLGGGSADAAATIRAAMALRGAAEPDGLLGLGADVPVCMSSALTRMRGIGEQLERFGPGPNLSMMLVNPGVGVATAQVFAALKTRDGPPMAWRDPHDLRTPRDWAGWLGTQRNDLEAPAITLAPAIEQVLTALRAMPGCLLARMSGSGASCFAILENDALRNQAVEKVSAAHPDWWCQPCGASGTDLA